MSTGSGDNTIAGNFIGIGGDWRERRLQRPRRHPHGRRLARQPDRPADARGPQRHRQRHRGHRSLRQRHRPQPLAQQPRRPLAERHAGLLDRRQRHRPQLRAQEQHRRRLRSARPQRHLGRQQRRRRVLPRLEPGLAAARWTPRCRTRSTTTRCSGTTSAYNAGGRLQQRVRHRTLLPGMRVQRQRPGRQHHRRLEPHHRRRQLDRRACAAASRSTRRSRRATSSATTPSASPRTAGPASINRYGVWITWQTPRATR